MDAYLEELYDLLTYCAQNPYASDFESKKQRVEEIGREPYADGGTDAMKNMFYSIEFRLKEEIGKDAEHEDTFYQPMTSEVRFFHIRVTNNHKNGRISYCHSEANLG